MIGQEIRDLLAQHPKGLPALSIVEKLAPPNAQSLDDIERKKRKVQRELRNMLEKGALQLGEELNLCLAQS